MIILIILFYIVIVKITIVLFNSVMYIYSATRSYMYLPIYFW